MTQGTQARRLSRLVLAATLTGSLSAAVAQGGADELAQRLVDLRSEVEQLNEELELVKQEHRGDMQALSAQKAELEMNRNRLETQVKHLEQDLVNNREEAAAAGVDNELLEPVLLGAIETLSAHISVSLPFKRNERIAELDEIRVQLETDVIPANRAANRLWAFYEDEIRLTRENGIYSQTIDLGGEKLLAEVAKLGTVLLFFRTADQRYGQVEQDGRDWRYVEIEDPAQIASLANLFDSLQKQIRQGYFELPNTLAGRRVDS